VLEPGGAVTLSIVLALIIHSIIEFLLKIMSDYEDDMALEPMSSPPPSIPDELMQME
jgi:hypothetical protein